MSVFLTDEEDFHQQTKMSPSRSRKRVSWLDNILEPCEVSEGTQAMKLTAERIEKGNEAISFPSLHPLPAPAFPPTPSPRHRRASSSFNSFHVAQTASDRFEQKLSLQHSGKKYALNPECLLAKTPNLNDRENNCPGFSTELEPSNLDLSEIHTGLLLDDPGISGSSYFAAAQSPPQGSTPLAFQKSSFSAFDSVLSPRPTRNILPSISQLEFFPQINDSSDETHTSDPDDSYSSSLSPSIEFEGLARVFTRENRKSRKEHKRESSINIRAGHFRHSPEAEFTRSGADSPEASLHFPVANSEARQSIDVMSISQFSAHFQRRMTEFQQLIKNTQGISGHIQDVLINEVRKISQEFNEQQRRIQQDFNRGRNEKVQFQAQLDDLHQQLRVAISDRDQYCIERDEVEAEYDRYRVQQRQSTRRSEKADFDWKRINDRLIDQTEVKEQLKGKPAIWLESNSCSSPRHDAATKAMNDPFSSPIAQLGSCTTSNRKGNSGPTSDQTSIIASSSCLSPSTASLDVLHLSPPTHVPAGSSSSRSLRRRPNLPTGKAQQGLQPLILPAEWGRLSLREQLTEPGDTALNHIYRYIQPPVAGGPASPTALVIHYPRTFDESLVIEYRAKFAIVFTGIESWTKAYSFVPNLKNDRVIASANEVLWAFMMNCTYPGRRQDSHTHVLTLLQDGNSRSWFIMRMLVTYCIKEVMTMAIFHEFSPAVKSILLETKKALLERGLANEVRQGIIDRQNSACQSVVDSSSYPEYRNKQLVFHTKRMRDMLGPLLDINASRSRAGIDLGEIAVHSWDLSVEMYTSSMSFQIYFPETSSKFTASAMVAQDQPSVDSMELQIKQVRLKLVITPVVTMRDDRGTTIRAKNLHKSRVLTMG